MLRFSCKISSTLKGGHRDWKKLFTGITTVTCSRTGFARTTRARNPRTIFSKLKDRHLDSRNPIIQVGDTESGRKRVSRESLTGLLLLPSPFIYRLRRISLRLLHQGFKSTLLRKSFTKFFKRQVLLLRSMALHYGKVDWQSRIERHRRILCYFRSFISSKRPYYFYIASI